MQSTPIGPQALRWKPDDKPFTKRLNPETALQTQSIKPPPLGENSQCRWMISIFTADSRVAHHPHRAALARRKCFQRLPMSDCTRFTCRIFHCKASEDSRTPREEKDLYDGDMEKPSDGQRRERPTSLLHGIGRSPRHIENNHFLVEMIVHSKSYFFSGVKKKRRECA